MVNLCVSRKVKFCALIVSDPKDWGSLCVTHVWWKVRVVHFRLSNWAVWEWGAIMIRNRNHDARVLAGTELIFFKEVLTVLYVGFATQTFDNALMFKLLLSSACRVPKLFVFLALPHQWGCCGVGGGGGGGCPRSREGTADFNKPKGYSMAYAIILSNKKSWVKTGGRKVEMFGVVECVFLSNCYTG